MSRDSFVWPSFPSAMVLGALLILDMGWDGRYVEEGTDGRYSEEQPRPRT